MRFVIAILLLSVVAGSFSCRKASDQPLNEEEIVAPAPPVKTVSPWDTLQFAEHTPLAIKKEIANWQQNFCLFSDVYEYQFLDHTVYKFETGCALESGSYIFDSSAVIVCVLKPTDDLCFGASFKEAGYERMIWSSYKVERSEIRQVRLINSNISAGERTFIEVKSLAGVDPRCAPADYEVILAGNVYSIKTFYRTPAREQRGTARKEISQNIEIKPSSPGEYIFRSEANPGLADTLIVR